MYSDPIPEFVPRFKCAHEAVFESDDVDLLTEGITRMSQGTRKLFERKGLCNIRAVVISCERTCHRAAEGTIRKQAERPSTMSPEDKRIAIGRAPPRYPIEESIEGHWIGGGAFGLQPRALSDDAAPHVGLAPEVHLHSDVDGIPVVEPELGVDDLVQLLVRLLIQHFAARGVVGDHVDHHGPEFLSIHFTGLFSSLGRHRGLLSLRSSWPSLAHGRRRPGGRSALLAITAGRGSCNALLRYISVPATLTTPRVG